MANELRELEEEVEASSASLLIKIAFLVPIGNNKLMNEIGDAIVRYKKAILARERFLE